MESSKAARYKGGLERGREGREISAANRKRDRFNVGGGIDWRASLVMACWVPQRRVTRLRRAREREGERESGGDGGVGEGGDGGDEGRGCGCLAGWLDGGAGRKEQTGVKEGTGDSGMTDI